MRGEEKGYFSLGGSAMLLVFSKNTVHWREDIQSASAYHEETQVMTGEVIGKYIMKNIHESIDKVHSA